REHVFSGFFYSHLFQMSRGPALLDVALAFSWAPLQEAERQCSRPLGRYFQDLLVRLLQLLHFVKVVNPVGRSCALFEDLLSFSYVAEL
ncbi:LOW QUALITY PROTEIN: hypothetical protein HID58_048375, partial [Brassica napus]